MRTPSAARFFPSSAPVIETSSSPRSSTLSATSSASVPIRVVRVPKWRTTLAHAPEPRTAGVTAVPAPFAELAADLSRRVPDFHCAAGDASGRVARLFDAPGDGAGVLVKPLPGGADAAADHAEPRPDALEVQGVAEEAADGAEPGRVGRPTLDGGFPGVRRISAGRRRDSGLAVYVQEGRTRGARRRLVFFLPLATSGARIRS